MSSTAIGFCSKSLFTLPESKREVEALFQKFGMNIGLLEATRNSYRDNRKIPESGDAVLKNDFIQKLLWVTGRGGLGME